MVKLNRIINYLAERNNEDLDDGLMFKKFNRREEMDICPSIGRNSRGNGCRQPFHRKPNEYQRSNLHYSFTSDYLLKEEEALNSESTLSTTNPSSLSSLTATTTTTTSSSLTPSSKPVTTMIKKKKSSMEFFSSLTKKLLSSRRSTNFKRYSFGGNGEMTKQKPIKFLNININKNINMIPMNVIETMYTISFTKHTYYIQRSLRKSTMIVNLITRFRNTYEELREIDTPKLKRRMSFKKRNTAPKKRGDQPREGSLLDLREQKQAKYGQFYQMENAPIQSITVPAPVQTMIETVATDPVAVPTPHPPRRRKRIPKKPLLDFSDCDSLPTIPATAAGSKVNQYLASHKESERKKLKPIKSIDKELCLIFNKEYIPEEQTGKSKNEIDVNTHKKLTVRKGTSLDNLHTRNLSTENVLATPIFSKHTSLNLNNTLPIHHFATFDPIPEHPEVYDSSDEQSSSSSSSSDEDEFLPEIEGLENISIFTEPQGIEEEEVEEVEQEEQKEQRGPSKTIPSPSSATTEVFIPDIESLDMEEKQRKRASEGTLYNEAMEEKHIGNVSVESDCSDKTLKDDDTNINDTSFILMDKNVHKIDFHIDSESDNDEEVEEEVEEEEEKEKSLSFILELDTHSSKLDKDKSFSLSNSFLLSNTSNESIIPEYLSDFLLNKTNIYSMKEENDLFSNKKSLNVLSDSLIYDSSKDTNDKKLLNRVDSGVDVNEEFKFVELQQQC